MLPKPWPHWQPARLLLAGLLMCIMVADGALPLAGSAQSRSSGGYSRSSGGYSRPGGYSSRTPSFGGGSRERTPSTSGGYARPITPPSGRQGSGWRPPSSPSDQAMARQSARDALEAFRSQGQRQAPTRRPSTGVYGPWDGQRRRDPVRQAEAEREAWYGRSGWSLPPSVGRSLPRFGVWDAVFLWYMLDTLARPGHAEFFHHHTDDPGYAAWRSEANRRAAEDPALRQKLAELDQRLEAMQGQPRSRDYLPADTPPAVALAAERAERDSGSGVGILVLLLLGAVVVWFLWRRIRAGRRSGTAGRAGSSSYRPAWFRVGMTIPVDPAPFILATSATHVKAPEGDTASGLLSVEAVGEVTTTDVRWYRLYLPGGQGFFQVHLDAAGQPDECRYFSRFDEVVPSGPEEWAFWLDPNEGVIGWPEFQTKDGKTYARVWAQGNARVAPRLLTETLTSVSGTTTRVRQAMLYAAPTEAAAPAPPTEYILVAAAEEADQAWVELYAGIDVNVGTLQLS